MLNGDLARFYHITEPQDKDFVRLEDGLIPSKVLPSYVDDVVEYDTFSDFPNPGEKGKIYLAKDTGIMYRWTGTQYASIASSDYNSLSNVPIINQDLGADGFVPEVGKYYRHTGEGGETTGTPIQINKPYTGGDTNPLYFNINYDDNVLKAWCQAKKEAGLFNEYGQLNLASIDGGISLEISDLSITFGVDAYSIDFGTSYVVWTSDDTYIEGIGTIPAGWKAGEPWVEGEELVIDENGKLVLQGGELIFNSFSTDVSSTEWNGLWISETAYAQGGYDYGTIYRCTSISPTIEYVELGKVEAASLEGIIVARQGSDIVVDTSEDDSKIVIGTHAKMVAITNVPSTATNGTLTEAQVAALQESDNSFIEFGSEKYYLMDKVEGSLTYSHVGYDNNQMWNKSIVVTINTLSWVMTKCPVGNIKINLTSGESGTLTSDELAILTNNCENLIFVMDNQYYRLSENANNLAYYTYIDVYSPGPGSEEQDKIKFKALYVNKSTGTWNVYDLTV